MRILHLASPGLGGIEAYIFGHYKYMDREKFQFDMMTQNCGLRDAEEYREFPFQVKLLPTAEAGDPRGFDARVREILSEGYDILHLHTCYWTGFRIEEIAKEIGVRRVIVHSHSTFIDEAEPEKREILFRRHEEVKRAFSPDLATDFCACSWKAADWLFGAQILREKIRIMKNAIDLERFHFDSHKREQMRKTLGLDGALVLGTVGRLSFQKNHAFLLEVFQAFHRRHPESKLLIVGDGELRGKLEAQICKSGLEDAVLLPGWRTNVEDYLQAMDGFLLPSRFEGLGIVIMEAAASGLPCIVSEYVPEEVEISQNICRIPLKSSAWLNALEEMTCCPTDRQAGAAYVRAAGYDIRRQAKVLEQLYEGRLD